MKDSHVMAFRVPNPLKPRYDKGWWQRPALFTIWHRRYQGEPDDWCYPALTSKQKDDLMGLAHCEANDPVFLRRREKKNQRTAEVELLCRAALELVARFLKLKVQWPLICRLACKLAHSPLDNFRGNLCFLPGYHTNFETDDGDDRLYCARHLFEGFALHLLRELRPWWKHPRWRFWRWRFTLS
jgi:hypothetical protein